ICCVRFLIFPFVSTIVTDRLDTFLNHTCLIPSSPVSFFERTSRDCPRGRGIISNFYHQSLLCLFHTPPLYRQKWEEDSGTTFSDEDWDSMVDNICKSSRSLSVHETAVKVLTRWYYTPSRLHILFPQTSPLFSGLWPYRLFGAYILGLPIYIFDLVQDI
ncbi:unnamed protein product, partial [Staurois parvus]